jgi:ADP-heptose:LPS heptosyltransferase
VVVEPRFRELLVGHPDVDDILSSGEGRLKAVSRLNALLALRRKEFAVCINLHGGPTSRFLTRMCGARIKVGFEHFRSPQHYQILVPDARLILHQPTLHTAEHQACAFFYLGLPLQEIPRARIFVSAEHKAWWEHRRASLGLTPGDEYVLIHPTALYASKQWAPEKFAQLAAWLERETGLRPVFSSGPGETAILDAIQNASGSPLRRLESRRLGQFAAALTQTRLFVGNDSGPAHMAAALSRPLVVIFGSSSSAIWGPWPRQPSNPPAQVVQNFFPCNPCAGDRCYRFERPECILSVSLEQVKSAVQSVLGRSASAP